MTARMNKYISQAAALKAATKHLRPAVDKVRTHINYGEGNMDIAMHFAQIEGVLDFMEKELRSESKGLRRKAGNFE